MDPLIILTFGRHCWLYTLHSLLKSLVFYQTLSFRKSIISYSIFGFFRRILSNRVVYNHCQSCLNSYKLIQCLFIIKKSWFTCENFSFWKFFKCSLFDRISCFGVLGSLKHARPPCKGPISVFFRFLISPSHHTVTRELKNIFNYFVARC